MIDVPESHRDLLDAQVAANLVEHDRPGESRVVVTIDPLKVYPVVIG